MIEYAVIRVPAYTFWDLLWWTLIATIIIAGIWLLVRKLTNL